MATYQNRIEDLGKRLAADEPQALALIPGPSLFYLTGLKFHLMERPILALFSTSAEPRMLVPELERLKAESAEAKFQLFSYGEEPGAAQAALERAVDGWISPGEQIGLEPLRMRYHELSMLKAALPEAEFIASDEAVSALRIVKDPSEIAEVQRAVEIAQTALEAALPLIQVGMTEMDLASEITLQLLRAGSEPEIEFSPIVASGPNAALPHAVPTDRRLEPGDSLILDWGAVVGGYLSDITRTFFIQEAPQELGKVYEIVAGANEAARAAVVPGVTCGDIDRAARTYIETVGYGEYFIHRTGHGLGLEAHEPPNISQGERTQLEEGMVFTIEPGIYLPGKGGVRIEDNVVVSAEGVMSLTTYQREMQVIG